MSTNAVAAVGASAGLPPTLSPASQQTQNSAQNQQVPGASGAAQAAQTSNSITTQAANAAQQTAGTDGKGQQTKTPPTKDQVEKAVSSVNDHLNQLRALQLEFTTDDQSGHMVIRLMDTNTKTMVRQIPPEYLLNLADNVGKTKGWLVEEKA